MKTYHIPTLPLQQDLETKAILIQLNHANRNLAELKGVALTIPNESILINTLILQEAKESSAVENIVTTHDELYRADANLKSFAVSSSTIPKSIHYPQQDGVLSPDSGGKRCRQLGRLDFVHAQRH